MAVQFAPVPGFTGPMMGVLWSRIRERFPKIQGHPLRDQTVEQFDLPNQPPQLNVVLGFGHPPPLVWYIDEDDSELIQVQHDRFVFNWRRRDGDYPRYDHVMKRFLEHFDIVQEFLQNEGLADELALNQWEVTYLNHIRSGSLWMEHGDLSAVMPSWKHALSDGFLPKPEDVAIRARYRINGDEGEPLGRLHIVVEPEFDGQSKESIINLRLTARGALESMMSTSDLVALMDVGHEWIVRGFACITSPTMHEQWERET